MKIEKPTENVTKNLPENVVGKPQNPPENVVGKPQPPSAIPNVIAQVALPSEDGPVRSKVVRISPRSLPGFEPKTDTISGTTTQPDEAKNLAVVARSFEPIVDKIIGLLDGTGARIIKRRAIKTLAEPEANQLAEQAKLPKDSRELGKVAGSRIAARRIKNPEMMDWVALSGVMTDWLSGLYFTLAELREIERNKKNVHGKSTGNS